MRNLHQLMTCILLLVTTGLFAQKRQITGTVTDPSGAPVPSATIKIKGTNLGTSAGFDGSFKLDVLDANVLIITGVGYESKAIKVGNATNLSVQLNTDSKSLSEVVVTGVGTATSKRNLGFAVESVGGEKLPPVPIASIDQALIGKVAGAQISTVSGNPGDQVNIVLRGINTVQGGTRPMVLMDGVEIPYANLSTLDLAQVARVEIVQGAASAFLYGAQGANGVIQIFSKKGSKGKMSINLSSSYGSSSFINNGHFRNSALHPYLTDANGNIIAYDTHGGFNKGDALTIDPATGTILGDMAYRFGSENNPDPVSGEGSSHSRYGILDPLNQNNQTYKGSLHYYDHFKQVFQSAPSYNNSLSIGGGNEKADYNIAIANNRTNSALLKDNGYIDRTNVTANLGMELAKGLTFRSITNLAYTKNTLHPGLGAPGGGGGIGYPGYGYGTSNAGVGSVYGFLNTPSFFSLEDTIAGGVPAAGYYISNINIGANAFNPFYQKYYSKGDGKRYDIIQSFEASYKLNKFVTLNGRYGVTYKNENDIWTYYNQTLNANSQYYSTWSSYNNGTDNTGEVNNFSYDQTKQNLFTSAAIKLDFEKDFHLKLPIQSTTFAGYDFRKDVYKEIGFNGYSLPLQPPFAFLSTQSQSLITQYNETKVTYGYIVDQKFDIGDWAGVAGGFRTDYSSQFGEGHTPFTFPHVNGYVNLPSFSFWEGIRDVLPNFKLRSSYGKAGIQPGAYQRQSTLNGQPTGNQAAYANPTTANNPALGVEVSAETEYGTDFTVAPSQQGSWFKSLNFSFSYWKRHTDNAIFARVLPMSTGSSNIVDNVITMHSRGWQLSVNIPVVQTKTWNWDFTANFGHQVSIIDGIVGGDIPLTTGAGSSSEVLRAGTKIGQIYGYKMLTSVNQLRADGKTPFIPTANQGDYSVASSGYVVNNKSKWLYISDEPTVLGDPNPKLTSSFINSVSYKGFITLGFQWDWIYGTHLYDQTDEWLYREGISGDWDKPVTINGQKGAWTAYYASAYYGLGTTAHGVGNNITKSFFYHDASFWRLRNVSVGVDFARFVSQGWLKKCQLVLSGRNLWTITKYPGLDPEISSGSSNSAFDRGIDHSTIPNMKAYQATINISL
ncbi:SusC/RagA family TonB-linked outer membrane protein [Flavitalea sp. BT771]|uniref:SusC/RagA family TonB-linked outer membrane protein n=1 Tax=Flavitalea sp. BT771 TaxID=3063329 RepID=UPI0026E32B58|nr:SusC/RagA family TonB-linked outer membrane protein [Flavitalea sp. BT771]MDO6433757.1 SusC/RagA family TonB-linked outer membrane protein [Flavitalea sp. BT771]MDV6222338.1 SusC/RagA family TonB-linked outer membrane protein [Flavitalea sp. BT771]